MRANEFARIAEMPSVFSATGACSRLEPQPKLTPATIMSPGWTFFAHVGSTASKACSANTFGSVVRSEEHTSELQSRLHLVCRLLLEKKKKQEIQTSLGNKKNREIRRAY